MYKNDFPLLSQNPNIHYLDSAATAQRPLAVIKCVDEYFYKDNGNAGRGSHALAINSSLLIDSTRKTVANFINSPEVDSIVFTKNCTEALNIIAYCYALPTLKQGDEILIGISNHHANIVPWQYVAQRTGAILKYVYLNADGSFNLQDFKSKLNAKTKIVAVSSVVNTTGVINPVFEITELAHKYNAIVVIDSAQAITHFQQDVQKLNCDFLTFSGHKLFSAFGVGVLYGKKELLDSMPPFLYGGDMINFVTEQTSEFKDTPHKYEGGTMDTTAIASLKVAIEYTQNIGYEKIASVIHDLDNYALSELKKLDFVETYQTEVQNRAGIIAFNVKDVHSHDTAFILNDFGVMVRSGHHCTQPLMTYLNVPSSCRASFGIYNTLEDIDVLIKALKKVNEIFNS